MAAKPESAEDWYRQGNAHQDQGRDDLAAPCYERAVQLEPAHARAWNNLGVSRQKLGDTQPAAEAYRRALAIDPALLQALINLAHLHRESGDAAGAEPLLARAATLDPSNPVTWEALGRVRVRLGRTDAAQEAFRGWLACDTTCLDPYVNLAGVEIARGNAAAAETWFRTALANHPENPMLQHMIAAVRGESTPMPAPGYVEALFDGMAPDFDRQLHGLGYRIPATMAGAVRSLLRGGHRGARVLELGCGTGLLGAELAPAGVDLTGIDLSSGMLERAAARGVYARLARADLVEYLRGAASQTFDAVLAADVFVYLGDLEAVFEGAARVLAPGGMFAFTVEALESGRFALRPNGRYAHSAAYLRELALRGRLSEKSMERVRLRVEHGAPVDGWFAIFTR